MLLLPNPQKTEEREGKVLLNERTEIVIDNSFGLYATDYAKLLKEKVFAYTGISFGITKGISAEVCGTPVILLIKSDILEDEIISDDMKKQGYELTINEKGIAIHASDKAGLLYGIQSVAQLIKNNGLVLGFATVKDWPLLLNRGFYHDATRGRIQTLDSYKKLADTMSEFKMNQLQLYIEHTFMFKDFSEVWRDDTPLTAEDILELDAYCKKLNIDLVPSIATFGHLYKVLRTKSFRTLCELEGMSDDSFSFDQRMQHHTLDVTNEKSFEFVKRMLEEFVPLFSSDYFNICADETFDLGKGRSKTAADKDSVAVLYTSFLKRIMDIVIANGKTPMFWGDILVGFPEYAKKLPEGVICLNWGYCEEEKEDATRVLNEHKLKQYLCPGVHGWRHFINRISSAYKNISVMCGYAFKYNALGLLNTDWGDYGHLQDPSFSMPGMIYGACFSWSGIVSEDEINRNISISFYNDEEGNLLDCLKGLSECECTSWEHFVNLKEMLEQGIDHDEIKERLKKEFCTNPDEINKKIDLYMLTMLSKSNRLSGEGKKLVRRLSVYARGQKLVNSAVYVIGQKVFEGKKEEFGQINLASELERFVYDYKTVWRESSREAELYRIEEVFRTYSDMLRRCDER